MATDNLNGPMVKSVGDFNHIQCVDLQSCHAYRDLFTSNSESKLIKKLNTIKHTKILNFTPDIQNSIQKLFIYVSYDMKVNQPKPIAD